MAVIGLGIYLANLSMLEKKKNFFFLKNSKLFLLFLAFSLSPLKTAVKIACNLLNTDELVEYCLLADHRQRIDEIEN